MKHFIFGFCAVLLLTLGPVRAASAQDWWRHAGPGPMGAGADTATHMQWPKWPKPHMGRPHLEKLTPLYTSPKSVGWWHKSPGPMGAGADKATHMQSQKKQRRQIRKSWLETTEPLYTTPTTEV